MIIYILVCLFIILYGFCSFRRRRVIPNGLKEIPLEKGLPIIGIAHKLNVPMGHYLKELGRKLGPLFSIRIGMRDVVILNNYEVIKKALVDDGQNFAGRWVSKLFLVLSHDSGILSKDGPVWTEQRKFVLKTLRDFGLGKSKSLEIVHEECSKLLEELDTLDGQIVNFPEIISIYIENIISRFIINKRFERNDPKIKIIEKFAFELIKSKDIIQLIYLMFPFIDESDIFLKIVMTFSSKWKGFMNTQSIFKEDIDEHLRVLNLNSESQDLTDCFLLRQKQLKQSTGSVESFTDWQLMRNLIELFVAGYERTSTVLGWSLLFMSKYQDLQEKIHMEIINLLGRERLPTLDDKKSLVYTQAAMDEILRLSTVTPLAIPHQTFNDTSINGYFIPKKSVVFPNLLACHYDPEIWENPSKFYPKHFLISDDKGNLKYRPREELIPFSLGKRQCLGESLAKMEFFIFFTTILQRFHISLPEEISESDFQELLIANEGFIRFSKVKKFIIRKRV